MFLGEFEYKIDDKGRVPIPPKFRRDLKDGVVLAAGPEKCIIAYSIPEWNKLADSLTSGTIAASKLRRLNRAFFATASQSHKTWQTACNRCVNSGTTSNKSPTIPQSATLKIGAYGSLFMATMNLESIIPARC